ncbi:F-box only protein 21-like isoform X2 [Phymastichus coffea]|uniref:F-box only protein 21-like isoform X2 n=1 Tax=Phymastichus coffea TaxID=108790 RepID=UPI00273AF5ED|nr:F-box only protein 21-like isoform X2 [Phymastichus coffea]
MAEDVLITFMPNEVIELIMENDELSIQDTVNFSLSCKHLHRIVFGSNKLWRTKFFMRWPLLKETYCEYEKHNKIKNWLLEVQASYESRKKLMQKLTKMSAKYYKKQELSHSEFEDFDPLFRPDKGSHPLAYHFLVDELITLIEHPTMQNLTDKYYAYKIVRHLKQSYLTDEWHRFITLPSEKQLLEQGATLVAQWSQPEKHVRYSYIRGMLDDIVEQAKEVLKERYSSHPIFATPPETLEYWKNNNIDDNQWAPAETKQIMAALCEVMFNKLDFHGNSEMYYSAENSFIDRVLELKRGIPITLAIVFESICRRVGVKCEPISFPAHFLLRWKEKYTGNSDTDSIENFYIDVFNGGQFLTRQNCPRLGGVSKCPIERYNIHRPATAIEVVERMANNLEVAGRQRTHLNGRAARLRSALELLYMVRPHDTGVILHLARFYMLYQMDLTQLDAELTSRGPANHILQMLQDYEKRVVNDEIIEVKKRTANVKFAIGMIMEHQKYDYLCVITGWDLKCEASPEWITEMGVDELSHGANQPFYNVFAHDGSSRYAAQENLVMAVNPVWIDHYETGRYFCQFKGTHYVPNDEKAKEYPEDVNVRDELITRYF